MSVGSDHIGVVILAGGRDFGRCPLAADLPTALWPVAGKPVLERLLDSLADQGLCNPVICCSEDSSLLAESVRLGPRTEPQFIREILPVGTAGCIRDAVKNDEAALIAVYPASVVCPPKIDILLDAHRRGRSDLTVMFNPGDGNDCPMGTACGIYVCSSAVLEHIPPAGYFDIKEGLIPTLLRLGKGVHAAVLSEHTGNFRDWREYLSAVGDYLGSIDKSDSDLKGYEQRGSQNVWIAAGAEVHATARICEPVLVMDGARVCEGAVIIGPAVLGRNVHVGRDAVVVESAIWDGARLGLNCRVQRSLVGREAFIRRDRIVEEESVLSEHEGTLMGSIRHISQAVHGRVSGLLDTLRPQLDEVCKRMPALAGPARSKAILIPGVGLLLAAFLWSYWPEMSDLWHVWQRSDEYSSGLLVPFLAVYVLWTRRQEIAQVQIKPSVWWGLLAFVAAQAFRLFGLFHMYGSAQRLSIVISIGALVLLLFGWRVVGKVFTVLLFLFLMVPWPNRIQGALSLPLQSWATTSAVFCLQIAGYDVVQHGNVIDIGGTVVEVAWACNGLRMVTAFFVVNGLVMLLVKGAWWEKLIIFASTLPVAMLCNTVRLMITSIAFTMLKGKVWEEIFHDFGGYAMMPLAIVTVVAELWLLRKLTTAPTQQEAIIVTRQDV